MKGVPEPPSWEIVQEDMNKAQHIQPLAAPGPAVTGRTSFVKPIPAPALAAAVAASSSLSKGPAYSWKPSQVVGRTVYLSKPYTLRHYKERDPTVR
jgi:hypothetical protein